MQTNGPKLTIGFITYGLSTAKYLPYFLSSLKEQIFKDFKVLAFDNSEEAENENVELLKNNYPEIEILRTGENLGFAKAYNIMINRAIANGAKYFLAINPDVIMESNLLARLIEAIDSGNEFWAVTPKILKWDFSNNEKTNIIDSCGLIMRSGLRFFEQGQSEIDKGQYDDAAIFGCGAAVALYKAEALEKVAENGQYYDELMFMYKEDCDLAYRLNFAGYKTKLVADALAYHTRTASGYGENIFSIALNRRNKSRAVKEWSFLNQQIIYFKYWNLQNFKNKLAIIWWEIKMLLYIIFFEQYLLKQILFFFKIKNKVKQYKSTPVKTYLN
jgi:GT2 family glycosyltransferase